MRKLNQVEYCSHPQASPHTCQGGIIRSHTLQMSGGLSSIAVDGHVYGIDTLGEPMTDGRPRYKLIGIRRASTFTGFCSCHDNEIFRPLEAKPFVASKEQMFLLAFRALSKELYAKRFAVRSLPLLRKGDKGKDVSYQVQLQSYLYLHEQLLKIGLRDLEAAWSEYNYAFLSSDYDRFSSYLMFTDKLPDLAVSGVVYPEFDFHGSAIQNLATPDRLHLLTYTVLPVSSRGFAACTWDAQNASSCFRLAASVDKLEIADVPDAVVRFTYEHFESSYANPQWWERLSERQREILLDRMALAASDRVNRKPDCLVDDGLRVARWKVVTRALQ